MLKGPLARSYVKKSFGLLKNRADNPHIRCNISPRIRCNICWSLSNITCKGSDYIDLVIGKTEYIEQLIHAALYDILEVLFSDLSDINALFRSKERLFGLWKMQ